MTMTNFLLAPFVASATIRTSILIGQPIDGRTNQERQAPGPKPDKLRNPVGNGEPDKLSRLKLSASGKTAGTSLPTHQLKVISL
jgi:hypothetical protein